MVVVGNGSLGNERGDLLHRKLAISHLSAFNVCLLLSFFNSSVPGPVGGRGRRGSVADGPLGALRAVE